MRIPAAVAVLFISLSTATTAQQHPSHNPPALTLTVLQRPIAIRSGIGTAHDPVPALPPGAQQYYDQGLALLRLGWADLTDGGWHRTSRLQWLGAARAATDRGLG